MAQMTNSEFMREQQRALERMKEMQKRSQFINEPHNMPPAPSFVKMPNGGKEVREHAKEKDSGDVQNTVSDLPIVGKYLKDPDALVILALILILYSEKSDKYLLFSLMYILL